MLKMKLLLSAVLLSLALSYATGAPSKARYKFVKCNPEGDQANCVVHQSPQMDWSPELPLKLPQTATQYLDAKPAVQDERPAWRKTEEESMFGMYDEGSGYEGSAYDWPFAADRAEKRDDGFGESWMEDDYQLHEGSPEGAKDIGGLDTATAEKRDVKPAEDEMREEHLLHP